MADIDIDYNMITSVANLLNAADSDLNPHITTMYTSVDNLLQADGGLWMSQTSPAIWGQYEQFNSAAQNCSAAIQNFSNMFSTLVQNMTSMDGKMAYSINNPTSSGSTTQN